MPRAIVVAFVVAAFADAGAAQPPAARTVPPDADRDPAVVWRAWGDTTLARLIDEALAANPDVQGALARVRGARAARRMAAFDYLPTVTAGAGFLRQRLAAARAPGVPGPLREGDLYDAGFDASWEVDLFGRVRHTVGAERALVAAAEYDLRDVQVSLAAEMARAYFELRGAQGQLSVAERNADNQRRSVSLTEQRLSAGRGTAFDTERARSQLSLTLAVAPLFQAQIAAAQYRIAALLARPSSSVPDELRSAAALPALPDSVPEAKQRGAGTSLSLESEALVRQRPDVRSAERQLAAQEQFVSAARTAYLPRLSVGASTGFTAAAADSLARTGSSRYVIGPTLSWPFLDMGRVQARVEESRARADAARAQYASTTLRARGEAASSLVAYDRARARLTGLSDAVSASRRAADLADLRFTEGVTDFLQVLDAQRTVLEAESQLAAARTDAATALVAVYKAFGGARPPR